MQDEIDGFAKLKEDFVKKSQQLEALERQQNSMQQLVDADDIKDLKGQSSRQAKQRAETIAEQSGATNEDSAANLSGLRSASRRVESQLSRFEERTIDTDVVSMIRKEN